MVLKLNKKVLRDVMILMIVFISILLGEHGLAEDNSSFSIIGKWVLDTEQYIESITKGKLRRDGLLFQDLTVYYEFFDDGSLLTSYEGNLFVDSLFPDEIIKGGSSWEIDDTYLFTSTVKYKLLIHDNDRISLINNESGAVLVFNRLKAFDKIVVFGHYEQDGDIQNGEEKIEWFIIEETDDYIFLMSKNALIALPYFQVDDNVVWEDSLVYSWLNGEFINSFSENERLALMPILVDDNGNSTIVPDDASNDTLVSLLTLHDVKKYINDYMDLSLSQSYIIQQYSMPVVAWWLYDAYPIGFHYVIDQYNNIAMDYSNNIHFVRPLICLSKEVYYNSIYNVYGK